MPSKRKAGRRSVQPPEPGSRRPYGRHLTITYGALASALVVGVVVVESDRDSEVIQRYGPNLVAELFGIIVTIVVVERLLAWQRERASTPVRMVALRRAWRLLNGLTHMLVFSYKAAAPAQGERLATLDSLLMGWQRHAPLLDFRCPYGPDGPPRSWHQYAAEVVTSFETGFLDLIDRYLSLLGPELVAAAEDVIDHPIFQIVKSGPAIEQLDAAHGWDLPRCSFNIQSVDGSDANVAREFARLVEKLGEAYDRLGGPSLSLDARLYEDHISPACGSARLAPQSP